MMDFVADLHLHSKYSRAVSPNMTIPVMAQVARQKGINLLTTGDFTHPLWFREIRQLLEEKEEGIYGLKDKGLKINDEGKEVKFILTVEIANIYTQGGKGRRIHNLVFAPNLETVEKINKKLIERGCNLSSDGRPIIGLSSKNLLQLILEIDERCILIPCHIWTPWFGIYGQMSGFESLSEAFGDMSQYIYGIETGLSSDAEMNWQIKELENRSILSFSDAHSPSKMGREATVFSLESLSYENIREAIMRPWLTVENRKLKIGVEDGSLKIEKQIHSQSSVHQPLSSTIDHLSSNKILYTLEFYPEEGKYHYSGHRNCKISLTPEETKEKGNICPVCNRKLTDGVMRRVEELASESRVGERKSNEKGLVWITDPKHIHPPFIKLVPLLEVIAEAIGSPVASPKTKLIFDNLCEKLGSEMEILLRVPVGKVRDVGGVGVEKIAEGIQKVREGKIVIKPGFDGVYGVVKIWNDERIDELNDSKEPKAPKGEKEINQNQIGLEF